MTANNCTNPPHFPPHCGCPAGATPTELPDVLTAAETDGDNR